MCVALDHNSEPVQVLYLHPVTGSLKDFHLTLFDVASVHQPVLCSQLRTERILSGEGEDGGRRSIRLEGSHVHLIFALHYDDKNYKVKPGFKPKFGAD